MSSGPLRCTLPLVVTWVNYRLGGLGLVYQKGKNGISDKWQRCGSLLGQAFGDLSQPLCDLCEEVSRYVRVGWGLGSTPPSDYNRLTRGTWHFRIMMFQCCGCMGAALPGIKPFAGKAGWS